jgi:hypothetical protein
MLDPIARMHEALAKAVVYRTFSLAFQAPTPDRLRDVGALDGFTVFIEALRCFEAHEGTDTLAAAVQPVTAVRVRDLDRLAGEYWRVFGHTTRGLVCACETEFGDGNKFQQPQELADIAGYYLAFGLTPPSASETRLDHVACECEFLEFLNRKQARLLAMDLEGEGDQETLEATAKERTFLQTTLRSGAHSARRLRGPVSEGTTARLDRSSFCSLMLHAREQALKPVRSGSSSVRTWLTTHR